MPLTAVQPNIGSSGDFDENLEVWSKVGDAYQRSGNASDTFEPNDAPTWTLVYHDVLGNNTASHDFTWSDYTKAPTPTGTWYLDPNNPDTVEPPPEQVDWLNFFTLTMTGPTAGTLGVGAAFTIKTSASMAGGQFVLAATGGTFTGGTESGQITINMSAATQYTETFTPTIAKGSNLVLTASFGDANSVYIAGLPITLTTPATTLSFNAATQSGVGIPIIVSWTESKASPGTLTATGTGTVGTFSPTLPITLSGTSGTFSFNETASGIYSLVLSGTGPGYTIAGQTLTLTIVISSITGHLPLSLSLEV